MGAERAMVGCCSQQAHTRTGVCVCVCVCIWLAGSSSLHVSFPKPFLKSRCELPIKERKLTGLKGRRAADEDSLSGSPSALPASISFSQDSGEEGDLGAKVGAAEGIAQGCGERLKSCVIPARNSPHSSAEPGGTPSAGLPKTAGGDQLPRRGPVCVAAQPVEVPTSLTLMMTASFPTPLRILYQIPGRRAKKHRFKTLFAGALSNLGRPAAAWPWQGRFGPPVGQVRLVVLGVVWGGPGVAW